jgi:hypothetical protein
LLIIAVGEKGRGFAIKHRLQEMAGSKTVAEKSIYL